MEKQPIRVVIVDDHQMVRETWKMILQTDNRIEVIGECASGAEAINMAHELKPHVMLMDINMAPVNGFEATRKISRSCPDVRIIGVSVNNQPGYARNMMQLGARGYVTKNSPREEMIRAILEVTEGRTFICQEVREKMTGRE
ncbi:MAG TPA: response regulator transcription factor [Chitinophagaceae bacterium]|jgi:DNA-binding NarL/FixJ family response regulator|nr:response regulator transcription factor [Chitinophagaceae bacterium]